MQGSICQFGIRMCVRNRRKKENKRDWQGLEGPGNKWGCLIMGIPRTVWHFLPSCLWALSAAEKNRALCSSTALNGGPEQFPREETERLIERVQCVARFFHYGHIFRRAVLTRQCLRFRVTSCLSLHTYTQRVRQRERERQKDIGMVLMRVTESIGFPFRPVSNEVSVVLCLYGFKWLQNFNSGKIGR